MLVLSGISKHCIYFLLLLVMPFRWKRYKNTRTFSWNWLVVHICVPDHLVERVFPTLKVNCVSHSLQIFACMRQADRVNTSAPIGIVSKLLTPLDKRHLKRRKACESSPTRVPAVLAIADVWSFVSQRSKQWVPVLLDSFKLVNCSGKAVTLVRKSCTLIVTESFLQRIIVFHIFILIDRIDEGILLGHLTLLHCGDWARFNQWYWLSIGKVSF
jgi:hypothetical protein